MRSGRGVREFLVGWEKGGRWVAMGWDGMRFGRMERGMALLVFMVGKGGRGVGCAVDGVDGGFEKLG